MKIPRLEPATTIFLLCDVQERFASVIHRFSSVVTGSQRMVTTANELGVPLFVTEQYPKGLGHTVPELDLAAAKAAGTVFEKTLFSMATPELLSKLEIVSPSATDAVIFGLEAHVCVQQTVFDLLTKRNLNVHLCVDAISSQQPVDRACGLHRAERAGAYLTTTESVMMELIRGKDHEKFKAISGALKTSKYDPAEALPYP